MSGKVYLVGAGPGDPDLLTVKGLRLIRAADVILYDHLANDILLSEARQDAELVYVGKESGHHHKRQETINDLLKTYVMRGCMVLRLKGGDPFVFGRGGEEALELAREHIPFEIVPGVTSAIAVPAYAGIPLTERMISSSVAIVTGHEDPAKESSAVDWARLAFAVDTLVILMGLSRLDQIAEKLLAAGKAPETPAAVIRWGTRSEQKTVTGKLRDIAGIVRSARLEPPAIIVVGNVVNLRENLDWFEPNRFSDRKVAVIRPGDTPSVCRA